MPMLEDPGRKSGLVRLWSSLRLKLAMSKTTGSKLRNEIYQCLEKICLGKKAALAKTFHCFCLGLSQSGLNLKLNSTGLA
jgi:hypothetical protein